MRESAKGQPIRNAILLTTVDAKTNLGPESYELTVTSNSIVICAPDQTGLFYGVQTLLQLFPTSIFATNEVRGVDWTAHCVQIEDWPRFRWRGLMLDVSRHFYTTAEVERILDLMALYKLNVFHWHLTDIDGWRIEIPQYPRLTRIGAWRKHWQLARNAKPKYHQPAWARPTADKFGPEGRYGGYYTPAQIRQVVAYAAARHITVVPEIEMPGHSIAALAAYPQLSCVGGRRAFSRPYSTDVGTNDPSAGVYDPANTQTFKFLDNVLREMFRLFPGKYVHIGGDEVPKRYWLHSPDCQALMRREGFTNGDQLQSYFVKRIAKFIGAHGKTPIGWSEILQGGLASNAVVMDWIGGAKEAAEQGHDVVMTPTGYCYFDHYQSTNHATEPLAIGGYLPLKKVYSFEPVPADLPAQFQSHILGAQANLWTEYVASLAHAEYMLFPRLCALAEVVWSPKDARNWADFQRRLKVNELRLKELGVNYRRAGGIHPEARLSSQVLPRTSVLVTPERKSRRSSVLAAWNKVIRISGTPLDMISYHFYATPPGNVSPAEWPRIFFDQADGFLDTVRKIQSIRRGLSPRTQTDIDEIGSILLDDTAPMLVRPIPEMYWCLSGATFAYLFAHLAIQGVQFVGESQLIGYPNQYASVSMVNWKASTPNARFRVLELLRDNFGPGDRILPTQVAGSGVFAQAFITVDGTRKILLVNKRNIAGRIHFLGTRGALETWVDQRTGYGRLARRRIRHSVLKLGGLGVAVVVPSGQLSPMECHVR